MPLCCTSYCEQLAELFVNSKVLLFEEGTVQGNPLAMCMYDLAIMSLILHLDKEALVSQVWYVDDAAASDIINKTRKWLDLLR